MPALALVGRHHRIHWKRRTGNLVAVESNLRVFPTQFRHWLPEYLSSALEHLEHVLLD